jgi:hypothetical protein
MGWNDIGDRHPQYRAIFVLYAHWLCASDGCLLKRKGSKWQGKEHAG